MSNFRAITFFGQTQTNLQRSSNLLGLNYSMRVLPYYSPKYHGLALVYPLAHAAHAIRDLFKIAEGGLLFIHALFNEPETSIPTIVKGVAASVGSLVYNCLDIAMSLISFVTRTISTLLQLGYTSSYRESFNQENIVEYLVGAVVVGVVDCILMSQEEDLASNTLLM